jgi:hypothetical protein
METWGWEKMEEETSELIDGTEWMRRGLGATMAR